MEYKPTHKIMTNHVNPWEKYWIIWLVLGALNAKGGYKALVRKNQGRKASGRTTDHQQSFHYDIQSSKLENSHILKSNEKPHPSRVSYRGPVTNQKVTANKNVRT